MANIRIWTSGPSAMRKPGKVRLTAERIRQIEPPKSGEVTVWDSDVLGFGVRCLPSGIKTYIVAYRAGYGRAGTPRRFTIGKVDGLRLDDARSFALELRARVLKGDDPVEQRRREAREKATPALLLSEALARYSADQERRAVAGRAQVQSSLRRHLLGHLTDRPVAEIGRRAVIEAVEVLEAADMPSAARALKSSCFDLFQMVRRSRPH